jgi:lipid-A-disaccharide synthase
VAPGEPLLALLPGSRAQEVRHILPPLAEGAARLEGVRVAVSRREGLAADLYHPAVSRGILPFDGSAAALAAAADAALVASGTATLETGLLGTPLAVVYRTGAINYRIARRVVALKTVGLVNIAAGGDRVPELIQGDLAPDAVAATAKRLLFDPAERREQEAYLATLADRLGGGGAAGRVAAEAARLLEKRAR